MYQQGIMEKYNKMIGDKKDNNELIPPPVEEEELPEIEEEKHQLLLLLLPSLQEIQWLIYYRL